MTEHSSCVLYEELSDGTWHEVASGVYAYTFSDAHWLFIEAGIMKRNTTYKIYLTKTNESRIYHRR